MRILVGSLSSQYIHMPLAPWCLRAAVEEKRPGDRVTVAEMNVNEPFEAQLRHILSANVDAVGLSVYIWNREQTARLVRSLKAAYPALPVALGGPEVSFCPEEALAQIPCDAVLCGAGEDSFPGWLDFLEGRRKSDDVPGLCVRTDDGVRCNLPAPAPAPCLAPYSDAWFDALNGRMAYVETSRGCPFSCAFCLSGQREKVLFMPKEDALALLIRLGHSGISIVKLIDRTFNWNADRTRFLLRGLMDAKSRGLIGDCCYHLEVTADLFDVQTLDLLRQAPAGLFQMEAGLQSFNSDTLDACRRHTDMDKLEANLRALLDMRTIHLHIDLIAGLPKEDMSSFRTSFNRAYALRPHMLQLGFLKLLYGSYLRQTSVENDCVFSPDPPYEVLRTREMSVADLEELRDTACALDRLYNSGRFQQTLDWFFTLTQESPIVFYAAMARRMDAAFRSLSHETVTRHLFEELTFRGLDAEQVRDHIALDRLSTDNTGYLPPLLARDMTALKEAARQARLAHPEWKKARFALLDHGRTLAVAAWTQLDPVSRMGHVELVPADKS